MRRQCMALQVLVCISTVWRLAFSWNWTCTYPKLSSSPLSNYIFSVYMQHHYYFWVHFCFIESSWSKSVAHFPSSKGGATTPSPRCQVLTLRGLVWERCLTGCLQRISGISSSHRWESPLERGKRYCRFVLRRLQTKALQVIDKL